MTEDNLSDSNKSAESITYELINENDIFGLVIHAAGECLCAEPLLKLYSLIAVHLRIFLSVQGFQYDFLGMNG